MSNTVHALRWNGRAEMVTGLVRISRNMEIFNV